MTTVGEGIAPESDIAVFAILGYDPREEHPGRGVVEALGVGMDFRDGDLAYRVNFATAEWPRIVDRRVGRDLSSDEARALADEVNEALSLPGATFDLRSTVEHRGVLVIRADEGALSAEVSNTDPAYRKDGHLGVALETFEPEVARCEPLEDTPEARRAAELTNAFVEGGREDPRRLRDQLGAPSGGQAAREPDPDAGRRRSPAVAATDRRTVRAVVGVLRRDARRTRDRADPRHGARGRPAPARGGGLRDLGPAGRSRRSRASTRSTSTSRVRTCRPTTAARRTSGTSSR